MWRFLVTPFDLPKSPPPPLAIPLWPLVKSEDGRGDRPPPL